MDSLNLSVVLTSYEIFSAIMEEGLSVLVTGVTYNGFDYLDDPTSYISTIRSKLDTVTDFAYDRVVVICSKLSTGNSMVIVIQGASYQGNYWVEGSVLDSLTNSLETTINTISGHSHIILLVNVLGREL